MTWKTAAFAASLAIGVLFVMMATDAHGASIKRVCWSKARIWCHPKGVAPSWPVPVRVTPPPYRHVR